MIILDTNVVSEMMRVRPDPRVEAWFKGRPPADLAVTVITLHELRYGIGLLAPSAERRRLESMSAAIGASRVGSVLPLDADAAETAADVQLRRRSLGRPIALADALIAGIAAHRDAVLATRNIRDFVDTGIFLVNPWQEALP